MTLMLSQSPPSTSPSSQSSRRLSVGAGAGAKTRTCVHCGRSFRRTEHLERHVRTHTKEKPYTCYCGAAFSRRDLLKRHMGITGHEDRNPPNKNTSPKSQHRTDHDTKRRRSSTTIRRRRTSVSVSGSSSAQDPAHQGIMPPSPEEAEWIQQSSYMKENGLLDTTDGAQIHDPEILEAAQLLLPSNFSNYPPAHPSPPTTSSYLPEETHHYEEFTNILDSLGFPLEWQGPGSDANNNNNNAEVAEPGLHPLFRERERERSRPLSPFRSWLPNDHQSSYGMIPEYGSFHHYYHPPEDIARISVPNF
ncbi:hypothetical protein BDW69DRAFT_86450 [Aspergillus filifer]